MKELLEAYLTLLFECFKWDVEVYSEQMWMYYLVVPAIIYTAFFMIKWAVLTAPIWLPFRLIISGFSTRINWNMKK